MSIASLAVGAVIIGYGICILLVTVAVNHSTVDYEDLFCDLSAEDELHQIRMRYYQRAEQAEADAERCCEILNVEYNGPTNDSDYAASIALNGCDVEWACSIISSSGEEVKP